jgi:uncharacterized radical SAM superfamily Fe-S cluster-containing enzyme
VWWRNGGVRADHGAQGSALSVSQQTTSLCETCLEPVPAKVIIEGENVYYLKRCRTHGVMKTLVSDDLAYWQAQKLWLKPGTAPDGTDPDRGGLSFRLRAVPRP